MTPERTRKLRELFDRAVELDAPERDALLAETIANDVELGRELGTLLHLDAADEPFLDRTALSAAAREIVRGAPVPIEPRTIPGYRILSKLGAGGMGEVFLAEDETLGRRVALKLLPESLTASAESLARFKREARAASALNHPGIMTVHEIGTADGVQFMATEYIEGETLRERLALGPISVADVLRIGVEAAEALAVAHEAGIIHRDIKPENIMVRRDGYVKVLDFGLAKTVEPASGEDGSHVASLSSIATEPGRMLGTVAYMSPEQLHGAELDERTDVWSLGIVLYELATGIRPFRGPSTAGIISAILTAEPAPFEGTVDGVPAALETVVRRSLEKDASKRYRTAREVWGALKALREDLAFDERVRLRSGDAASGAMDSTSEREAEAARARPWFGRMQQLGWPAWAAIAVVLASVMAGIAYTTGKFAGSPAGEEIRSIAVLPFLPVGNGERDEALELGMADTLITRLSVLRQLDIRPVSAVRKYTQSDRDPLAAGRDLNVSAVLDGTLQRAGDRLRVNLRLLRVRDGAVVWATAIDESSLDLFKLQDTISDRVIQAMRVEVSGWEQQQMAKRATESSEAYQFYVRGRYFLDRRGTEWRRKSVEQFSKAVEIDPAYAPAFAGLSDVYSEMAYWGDARPREYMPKAREAARRALELDESLAEAHTSLGVVLDDYDWKPAEAEREYRRAIELNPSYALAYQRLGQLLAEMGRFDEAIAVHRRALELDPLSLNINVSLGAVQFLSRDWSSAEEQLKRTLELDPGYVEATGLLAWLCVLEGRSDEGARLWLGESTTDEAKALRSAFARGGIRAYFTKDLELADALKRPGESLHVFSAMELAYLGRKDEAFSVLEKAFEERNSWLGELNVDPSWDPLRSDPRFGELVRRVRAG